ncbi:L,D-transpeptidase family protein [Streptomyces sp. NPDC002055]|uniref:L,D-transpeptidase family protein n=1 Tax=Streptomyces sp. NPDC002055 TaxID=3154534 RepID=UPI00331B7B2F
MAWNSSVCRGLVCGGVRGAVAAAAAVVLAAGAATGCTSRTPVAGDGKAPARTAPATASRSGPPSHRGPGTATGSTRPAPKQPSRPSAAPRPAAPAPVMALGSRSARVRELQARLRELGLFGRAPTGYYGSVTTASVRSFQARRHRAVTGAVDPGTWAALRALTRQPSRAALYPPTSRPLPRTDPRCRTGRVLCISKSSNTLAWMADGRVLAAMDVRFGSQYTPTREGVFAVTFKSRHHVSTIYRTPMPYAMFFSGGQAVHYSADFAARGYAGASHGCVNVRDRAGIAAVFAGVRPGDKVVVHR